MADAQRPRADLARVGLFWSGQEHPGPTEYYHRGGSYVAAAAWTRAFVRHAHVPTVEIFAPAHRTGTSRQQLLGMPGWGSTDAAPVAQFYPTADLPARCEAHAYDVFHSPEGCRLATPEGHTQ